jgi:hypothetical protein
MKALGEKAPAFFAGFIAGTAGIEDATEALANFDAAAVGFDFGAILGGALAEPGQAFVAMGEGLLLAITTAADFLVNSVKFAADVYAKAMMDPALWMGVSEMLMALIGGLANKISQVLLSAIKVPIEILADLPTIMGGKVFKGITAGIEAVQGYVDEQASQAGEELVNAVDTISTIIGDAARSTERNDPNLFKSDTQSLEFQGSLDKLREAGKVEPKPLKPKTPTSSDIADSLGEVGEAGERVGGGAGRAAGSGNASFDEYAKVREQYIKDSARMDYTLTDAERATRSENSRRFRELHNPEMEAMYNRSREGGPSAVNDATMTEPERKRAAAEGQKLANGEAGKMATETTLQKAVDFLKQLTEKLPQPALV